MAASNRSRPVLRTLIFTLRTMCRVAILVPVVIVLLEYLSAKMPAGLRWWGLVPAVLGAVTYLLCAGSFAWTGKGTPGPRDPTKVLVTSGLYRFSRNPMYIGVLLLILGQAILLGHGAILYYAYTVFWRFQNSVVSRQEPDLLERFGATYEQYCKRVPRWI